MLTTSGIKQEKAISAQDVLELVMQSMHSADGEEANALLEVLFDRIQELPSVETINGQRVKKAYYPRIMVRDSMCGKENEYQIGGNYHHQLEVKRCYVNGKLDSTHIAFLNTQCMCGTEYAEEGYQFVGEKMFEELGDETEVIPFDEVWVKDDTPDKFVPSEQRECNIGDTAYIARYFHSKRIVKNGIISSLEILENGNRYAIVKGVGRGVIGERVFLTEKEAEEHK